jgi:dihydroflavonol-4-reductase
MIAVTGANGLLGSVVVRKLLESGDSFVALRRKGSDTSLLSDLMDKIQWREADIMDPVSLLEAFEGVTRVIHAAAIVSFNPKRAKEVMNINALGTRNVVNACLDREVKRLVYVSSVAALCRQKGQSIIDESNKWVESSVNSTYAHSKYLGELEVFRGQEEGLSSVIINPSFILAGADWNVSSAQLFQYAWDQRPFYIDGSLNYVDVLDVANIVYALVHDTTDGERYIVSAGKISFKDLLTEMATNFKKRPPRFKLTRTVLKPVSFIEAIRTRITGTEPRLTRDTARLAGSSFVFDNSKIRKKLNYEFQPIDATLRRCCGYYIEKNKAKK